MPIHTVTHASPLVAPRNKAVQPDSVPGGGLKWVRARYDFAVDGGTIGTIGLLPGTFIPSGAIAVGGFVEILTPPDGAAHTATVAVQLEAANDLVSAIIVTNAQWVAAGRKAIIPVFTAATTVKTTAARNPSIVIAVENLTAGKFDLWLAYLESV